LLDKSVERVTEIIKTVNLAENSTIQRLALWYSTFSRELVGSILESLKNSEFEALKKVAHCYFNIWFSKY